MSSSVGAVGDVIVLQVLEGAVDFLGTSMPGARVLAQRGLLLPKCVLPSSNLAGTLSPFPAISQTGPRSSAPTAERGTSTSRSW